MKKYLKNCFLLLLPILLWNVLLFNYLPESFRNSISWKDIPNWVGLGENILRIAVMGIPFLMVLSFETSSQKAGLAWYLIGTVLYFLSWIMVIAYPESDWSLSVFGYTAPAFTPIIWLVGIGLIGQQSFLPIKHLSQIYQILASIFVLFHTWYAYLVYVQIYANEG